jgi:microtubule-associated protein-like 1/2
VHAGWNRHLLLAGDSDGFVRLFRYPCTSNRADFFEVKPCSGPAIAVRFLIDDIYAVTVGGTKDAALMRWKIKE